jgi:chorismate mutase
MSEAANPKNLNDLRKSIDDIDAAIVNLLAERMAVCKQVAAVKAETATAVMQPQRVREVLNLRRQWAIDKQVDPDFTEQLFRILLAETHRIEIAEVRTEPAPSKTADALRSALDTVACRIDHVVVAVTNLPAAIQFLTSLGFKTTARLSRQMPAVSQLFWLGQATQVSMRILRLMVRVCNTLRSKYSMRASCNKH